MKKRITALFVTGILLTGLLAGCKGETEIPSEPEPKAAEQPAEEEQPDEKPDAPAYPKAVEAALQKNSVIADQTFSVTLSALGEVTFTSYEPDKEQEPLADAVFTLEKEGEVQSVLPGMTEDNLRANQMFDQVKAVSFPDYNSDGVTDIFVICGYSFASGPDAAKEYVEGRIYTGNPDGTFTLEQELTENTNAALAEVTIESMKSFLGVKAKQDESWKDVYLGYLQHMEDPGAWNGYVLIYLDEDNIPELVKIGTCEAAGCQIVACYEGKAYENQLRRLYFSYQEKKNLLCNSEGNMDSYTDLVYRLKEGKLELVGEGWYGAEDNSKVQMDEAGEPIYQYRWQGEMMSKEAYEEKLQAVYDTSQAVDGYTWDAWLSLSEMIETLQK